MSLCFPSALNQPNNKLQGYMNSPLKSHTTRNPFLWKKKKTPQVSLPMLTSTQGQSVILLVHWLNPLPLCKHLPLDQDLQFLDLLPGCTL